MTPCIKSLGKKRHSILTDGTVMVETTNTLEDKSKILEDLDPMSNSVNKEGEIQSMKVQGHIFSNNLVYKYCLEKH